jgi:hypothetical protein
MAHPTDLVIHMSQSKIKRIQDRAAAHWSAGRPHSAWQTLSDAGLEILWPTFLRTAKTWGRDRYIREITRHST